MGSGLAALLLSAVGTPEKLIKTKNLQNQFLALKWIHLCIENTRSAHKILLHYEYHLRFIKHYPSITNFKNGFKNLFSLKDFKPDLEFLNTS